MIDYKKYINTLRKCAKEHENDGTLTGHIIVSDLCRDTANLLEALEQEPILDKMRERIELEKLGYPPSAGYYKAIVKVLQIIDKCRMLSYTEADSNERR